jgi:hypothetical protein
LITQKPGLVLHVEPTVELYDSSNLLDSLAMKFHFKRGYTTGLLPYLQDSSHVDVIQFKRLFFGNFRMEGYNYIVWRPL